MLLFIVFAALITHRHASGVSALSVTQIPNGRNRVSVNGHAWLDVAMPTWRGSSTSAGPTNQFITDLAAAASWATLCAMDSDGDGYTNGQELGDPSCVWTAGATPARVYDISHPGLWSSVPLKSTFPAKTQTAAASCPAWTTTTYKGVEPFLTLRVSRIGFGMPFVQQER